MANNKVVGFIGLGTMGGRMAGNLQQGGFKLIVHDLHRQAASHHLAAGATWADTPRALAQAADVIFTSLGVMVAEWLLSGRGLGNLLNVSRGNLDYDMIWAGAMVSILISVAAYQAVVALESLRR